MGDENQGWAADLDALVAANAHHTLLFENEMVRVVETRIPAGEITAVHTHRLPGILLIQNWSAIVRRNGDGEITLDTRQIAEIPKAQAPLWQLPLPPHSVENVGGAEFRAIQIEIKDAG